MKQPLQSLYQTRLALLATLTTVVGVVILVAAQRLADTGPSWLQSVPLEEIGGTFLGTGLVVILFEYLNREAADARAKQQLDEAITEHAPVIRDAVIEGFAFNADDLARVASPETLDQVARNTLALQLGDKTLAEDVYNDIKDQIIRTGERWYDLDVTATLSPWEEGPASGPDAMFVATIRREYRVAAPNPIMRFACVSSMAEYREHLADPSSTFIWYFNPAAGLTGASRQAFELVQFTVDGRERSIRRSERTKAGSQVFTVQTGIQQGDSREVTISYTYRALVRRHGHLLRLDIAKPTKGVRIELRYGGCGLAHVNTVDAIASARPTHVIESPPEVPTSSVEVSFDGWAFPKSRVAFVWVLEGEV